MLRLRLLAPVLAVLVGLAACTTTSAPPPDPTTVPGDDRFQPRSAYLFVNGEQKGVTPSTVTVRRGLGAAEVSLRVGPKLRVVRRYEFEYAPSSSRTMHDYTFGQTTEGGMLRLYASELPTRRNGRIVTIPFFARPILIVDRLYQLDLIVEE